MEKRAAQRPARESHGQKAGPLRPTRQPEGVS